MADSQSAVRRCSIAGALDLVGDRWSLLILRELGFGNYRFTEMRRRTGAPRDILTSRLRKLEDVGVISREPDPSRPGRQLYRATKAGAGLTPVLIDLKEWGDRHVNPGDEPLLTGHSCGAVFHPRTHCAACGQQVRFEELRVIGGDDPLTAFASGREGAG
jgi:DNA-binding HxlR family transcriptional regulator